MRKRNREDDNARVKSTKLNQIIRKLRVKDNSVLLIKRGSELAKFDILREIQANLTRAGFKNVVLIVADELNDIEAIPPQVLQEHGWIKVARAADRIMKAHKENREENEQEEVPEAEKK